MKPIAKGTKPIAKSRKLIVKAIKPTEIRRKLMVIQIQLTAGEINYPSFSSL
ncbi:MAG: hypothetical protein ABIT08_17495 [Bacteroidia bacterium]